MQSASQHGNHNIIVQAHGDNLHIALGLAHLQLVPVAARLRRQPSRAIDILNPAFQAVPLVGRDDDMQFLQEWIHIDKKIAITALVGPGGSGKTRLAFDFLEQLPPSWQGGFLTLDEAERFLAKENISAWQWQKPTLVITDYAAFMATTLSRWFSELADHSEPRHSLRILMLERHADAHFGWFHDLADSTWSGREVREMFYPSEPRLIKPLDEAAQRREVLEKGLTAAAALLQTGQQIPALPSIGTDIWLDQKLAERQWADPLILLMAALIATTDGLNVALRLSRPELATELAKRERDLIRRSCQSTVAKDLLAHLYACVTLCGGLERGRAQEVAEQEFAAMRRDYPAGAGQAVEDLANFLGTNDRLPPLLPDLLGEFLVRIVFGNDGAATSARLSRIAPVGVVQSLIRCAQDFGPLEEHWPVEWLGSLVQAGQSTSLLIEIEKALPPDTLVLRKLAVDITIMLIEKLEKQMELPTGSAEARVRRSQALQLVELSNNLATRQIATGQRVEALGSITKALEILNTPDVGDSAILRPTLAQILNTHASVLDEVGENSKALTAIEESVKIRRQLAKDNPSAFLRLLAYSLNNRAIFLEKMGQLDEAISTIKEAVEIHRSLVDGSLFSRHVLAGSLNNLFGRVSAMGQHAEANVSILEATELRRQLAEANPDAYLSFFGETLGNLSISQGNLGCNEEALATSTEVVTIMHRLVESDPAAFQPNLASALGNHANRLLALGRFPEALESISEALAIDRILANQNPGAYLPDVAWSLNRKTQVLVALRQLPEALAAITQCVEIYRTLASRNPSGFTRHLAGSLMVLSDCLSSVGRLAEARDIAEESLRRLLPAFLKHPTAFEPMAKHSVAAYILRCRQLGLDPDIHLINQFSQ